MEYYNDERHSIGRNSSFGGFDYSDREYVEWINRQLAAISPPLSVNSLTEPNMCNGVAIGLLLETVGNLKLNGLLLQPGTRVERLHNVHEVFTLLRLLNIRLDNVQPEDVMNGNRETIMQVVMAIASHFSGFSRGRQSTGSVDRFNHRQYSSSSTPRAVSRQTPIDRFGSPFNMTMPSEHYTELTNARYSHEIIGQNVYTENHSGKSSPRSRSSMTVLFSGQRSPTGQRRPSSRYSSEGSETLAPSEIRSPKPRSGRDFYDHRHVMNNHSTPMSPDRATPALPHYIESMNELSNLKTQLNTISKLIAADTNYVAPDMRPAFYSSTPAEAEPQRDIQSDLKLAQQQIAELTRIVHTKDQSLRQKDKEIAGLRETIRSLREALYQQEVSSHYASTGHQSSHSQTHTPQPTKRRSAERHSSSDSHSHDPRTLESESRDRPKKRSRSRDRQRQTPPMDSLLSSAVSRKPEQFVKKMSLDLNPRSTQSYTEDAHYQVKRY